MKSNHQAQKPKLDLIPSSYPPAHRTIPTPNKITTPTNPNSRTELLFPNRGTEPLVLEAVEAAAEPDFEAEPVAESPDADYQRKSIIEGNKESETNALSS